MHLNPLRPASWSDLALTQHQRVMLSAAHSTVCDTPMDTEALCATAERVLMAALRLAPDVPGLWSALGSVETAPAKREYALRRALQLDPSDALTWLKLGRLYHAHSLQGKATVCPFLVAVISLWFLTRFCFQHTKCLMLGGLHLDPAQCTWVARTSCGTQTRQSLHQR